MSSASSSATQPLAITGDFTVAQATEWHRRLTAQLTGISVIDLSGITSADVFGVQLLCALRQAAGRSLDLVNAPAPLLAAATAAGIPSEAFLTRL